MSLLDDPQFRDDLQNIGLSASQVVDRWPGQIGKTSVLKYRKALGEKNGLPMVHKVEKVKADDDRGYKFEHDENGALLNTRPSETPQTREGALELLTAKGIDPDAHDVTFGFSEWEQATKDGDLRTLYAVRVSAKPKRVAANGGPLWPIVQPAQPVTVELSDAVESVPRAEGLNLSAKCADHQIGFRALPDGTFDPFHSEESMALFVKVCRLYQPNKIQVLGDFLDLPSQSRWAQEASFARTTQMALDTAHRWLAELRAACPDSEIVVIEGNHDKRMQNFMETNALAAFGLRRADMPDSWPVMSLPNLLRLDDLNVRYIDAYPAATDWDNATTRNIHGTRANSKGSTTSQYIHELPHINTWTGHTHRLEITYHSVLGPFGHAIESYSANPGAMCRTDGAAPSVHGAIGADGIPAPVVENWQNGFGFLYYNETESWPQVYRILNGRAIIGDRILTAN